MAYNDALGSAQTAHNSTAVLTAAFAQAGFFETQEEALTFHDGRVKTVTDELTKLAAANPAPAPRKSAGTTGGSKGGTKKNVESDGSMSLKGGAFDGYTIAQVWEMSKSDISDNGIEYDRTGREYVEWLANNTHPKAGFKRDRAKAFIEAQQAGVAE